jgi:UDP-N-acetylglucosamine acyltransferase
MASAHIAHDCHVGNNAIIVNGVSLGGHVTVGNYASWKEWPSAVHQFINIGDHYDIWGSLLRKDVPPLQKQQKSLCLMWELIL